KKRKKRRGRVDRAEDSTIGGEWRNVARGTEGGGRRPRTGTSIPYCAAQCKMHGSPKGRRAPFERSAAASAATATAEPGGRNLMKARVKWLEDVSFVAETGSGHAVVVD